MQFWDIWNILKEEVVNPVIGQYVLVKLSHDTLELIMTAHLLKNCSHYVDFNYFTNFKGKINFSMLLKHPPLKYKSLIKRIN